MVIWLKVDNSHYPLAGTVMNKNENGRCNRRDPFITGISRKGKPFDDDGRISSLSWMHTIFVTAQESLMRSQMCL